MRTCLRLDRTHNYRSRRPYPRLALSFPVVEYTFCQPRDFANGPRCCSGVEGDVDALNVCKEGKLTTKMAIALESNIRGCHSSEAGMRRFPAVLAR